MYQAVHFKDFLNVCSDLPYMLIIYNKKFVKKYTVLLIKKNLCTLNVTV